MSQYYREEWESDPTSPWTINSLYMARTATSPMDGSYDVRLDTVAGQGYILMDLGSQTRLQNESRRGLRIQASFKLKFETLPTGNLFDVLVSNGTHGLYVVNTTNVFRLGSQVDLSFTNGATVLTANTEYAVQVDFRYERTTGVYLQMWLNGTLEVTHRDVVGSSPAGINFLQGGWGGSKGVVKCRWGDISTWIGADPQ